jgi:hypothetical protein
LIEAEPGNDWRALQQRVAAILRECGLEARVEAPLDLARGSAVIDVLATDPTTQPPAVYLCECKRWRTNVPQGEVQTFRTIVADAGAHFGLFISATGFQRGASEVVTFTNIHLLNWTQFQELFVERWCQNYWVPTVRTGADRLAGYIEPPMNDAPMRFRDGATIEPEEAVGLFVHDLWGVPFNSFLERMQGQPSPPVARAIWEHRDQYAHRLPQQVAQAATLRELHAAILSYSRDWLRSTGREPQQGEGTGK